MLRSPNKGIFVDDVTCFYLTAQIKRAKTDGILVTALWEHLQKDTEINGEAKTNRSGVVARIRLSGLPN